MKKYKLNFNLNLIKKDYSYTIQEIYELLGVTKRTVGRWIEKGLPIIDSTRPYLIHSEDLREFLKNAKSKRTHKCEPNEFFCCKCQKPRTSIRNSVGIFIKDKKRANIKGLCSVCSSKLNKITSVKKLPEVKKIYRIVTIHNQHLIGSLSSYDTVHLKTEEKTEQDTAKEQQEHNQFILI